ncbi:hypothetical protein ACQW02_09170 [Humitalea sp. 24SJ18S-53]|uniref:hypothetical protein n=1 Tax=Humitalea sp. 24SJ18S-53 TaxID=3422307 RepID=UPI003D67151B
MPDAPDIARVAEQALALAEAALTAEATRAIPDEAVQQLIAAGLKLFAAKVELEQRHFLPVGGRDAVTPTEVAVTVTELLRAVDLNLFDLSMWAGRPRFGADETGLL